MEGDPGLMFPVLAQSGLLATLLPELMLEFEHGRPANDAARILIRSLQCAAGERLGLAARFALVASRTGSAANVSERLKAPGDCRDLALLAERYAGTTMRAVTLSASELLELLERCDAFRRPDRFDDLLAVTECLQRGERGWGDTPYMPRVLLRRVLAAAAGVDAGRIAAESAKDEIAPKLRRARIAAIEALA
jgi:tRNA nucleotidyltransferase (CCA-adding enzyme)